MPMMTAGIAVQIASGRHFNMPERIAMGLWPHPPIHFEWLCQVLVSELTRTRFFPSEPRDDGPPLETLVIEHEDSRFIGRSVQYSPLDPTAIQKRCKRTFADAREAAEWYLKWELGISPETLPAKFDGWTVA